MNQRLSKGRMGLLYNCPLGGRRRGPGPSGSREAVAARVGDGLSAAWIRVLTAVSSPASAAFLLSLYIQDVWLGAQRPDTLLAHVQMVREAAEDAPGAAQEPIVGLCEDIAALAPDA